MYSHFWALVQGGTVESADIQAELDDLNAHYAGSIVEEAHVLDLHAALAFVRVREQAQRHAATRDQEETEPERGALAEHPGAIELPAIARNTAKLLSQPDSSGRAIGKLL